MLAVERARRCVRKEDLRLAVAPGGTPGQLQWNSASTFGGVAGSAVSTAGGLTLNNGAVTTSAPVLDLSQEWNAGAVTFSGIKLNVTNTASNAASRLVDIQYNGGALFGMLNSGQLRIHDVANPANYSLLYNSSSILYIGNNLTPTGERFSFGIGSGSFGLAAACYIGWGSSGLASGVGHDVGLHRAAANVLDISNGSVGGVAYARLNGVAVASLPTASATYLGARGTVNNSNATLTAGIGAVVAGGGSNIVPVFCDGAAWRIG